MMRACLLTLALAGCGTVVAPIKPQAYDVGVNPACYDPCTETGQAITADPDSAITSLLVEHQLRKTCELRRQACVQALQRGQTAGAIK